MPGHLTIALAGNPNSGKSTVFNNLTGVRQHVGNYPGVTVERREGYLRYGDYDITVVDLPGIYSLSTYSIDEIVARDFILDEKPDVVIDIVDSSNIERHLYLATQLIELGVPLVIALNMSDLARSQGLIIDEARLGELLGTPLIPTVASEQKGMEELLAAAIMVAEGRSPFERTSIRYGKEIRDELDALETALRNHGIGAGKYPPRWLALKLIEEDSELTSRVRGEPGAAALMEAVERSVGHLRRVFRDDPEAIIADRRYGFISGACSEATRRRYELRHTISDRIDEVIVNRILGLPIFLGAVWLLFKFTFGLSEPMVRLLEMGQERLAETLGGVFVEGSVARSLCVDAIIGGVGSVLVFVPPIFLLFFAIGFMEDSGYMARAAFIMDKFMHRIGLHGRSFIPMLIGFGCNLPAIMATRTIEDRRDRLVTILVIPFMSCGARLPVYTLFTAAFFTEREAGNVLFSIYLLGIAAAIASAKMLRRYVLRGPATPFVMELPPYRMPTMRGLLIHMWERGVIYLKKAGTVILAGSVILWFLSTFPVGGGSKSAPGTPEAQAGLKTSYAARLGKAVAPVFKPCGFDDWRLTVGLMGGFVAKEIVVSTLGTLYAGEGAGAEGESLREALRNAAQSGGGKLYSPLVAYSIMVFVLLYVPCLATIAVIRSETNSIRWPAFAIAYQTALAWGAACLVYQGGMLLGLG